ncbi:MAG TPA: PilZ domain-containing protein [Thermodesulfovibrionales bacterium]|nr:PilZ domain-containing protein [Thermodesulfovibrionales bacterium]
MTNEKVIILAQDIGQNLSREQSFLGRADIRTLLAESNEQAFDLHKSKKADLIVAQIDSPGMSGEELCSVIRQDKDLCNVSIIIVCLDSISHHQRCLKCQANSYVTMPINNAILLQEMYHLLHVAPRKSCRIPLSIKVEGSSRKMPFTAHADNVSTSGMLFQTSAQLSEGDTITCSFSLPDSSQVTATAEIVRMLEKETKKNANRYGVRFVEIDADSLAAIESFLSKNCSGR